MADPRSFYTSTVPGEWNRLLDAQAAVMNGVIQLEGDMQLALAAISPDQLNFGDVLK